MLKEIDLDQVLFWERREAKLGTQRSYPGYNPRYNDREREWSKSRKIVGLLREEELAFFRSCVRVRGNWGAMALFAYFTRCYVGLLYTRDGVRLYGGWDMNKSAIPEANIGEFPRAAWKWLVCFVHFLPEGDSTSNG